MARHQDKRPLLSYLRLQERMEQQLLFNLQRSSSRIDRELRTLERKVGVGGAIRRDQLRASKAAIQREIASLWRLMGSEINARRAEAASAATEQMFEAYERVLWRAVMKREDVNELLRSRAASAGRTVDVVETRILGYSQIPLSERVYKSQQLFSGRVDRVVDQALTRGASAKELADEVRPFIRADTRGGIRYAAMRLGRTELNNAFHATQVRQAVLSPAINGMRWNLSGSHPRPDACNDYADHGVWEPREVPEKPHPQCLCYLTPETVDVDRFVSGFKMGEYDSQIEALLSGKTLEF